MLSLSQALDALSTLRNGFQLNGSTGGGYKIRCLYGYRGRHNASHKTAADAIRWWADRVRENADYDKLTPEAKRVVDEGVE